MDLKEYGLIVLCGSITLALRLAPMLVMRRLTDAALSVRARRALSAIGPAALASLVLISLWPISHTLGDTPKAAATLTGLLGVAVAHQWRRNLALSVFVGATAYAVVVINAR